MKKVASLYGAQRVMAGRYAGMLALPARLVGFSVLGVGVVSQRETASVGLCSERKRSLRDLGLRDGLAIKRFEGHLVDALASRGDEGRGTLRKAVGSCEQALIRGYPNGETRPLGVMP